MRKLLPTIVAAAQTARRSPLTRTTFWLVCLNYSQALITCGINLWLARELGSAGFGLISYGMVVATIGRTVCNFSTERTLVRDLIQHDQPNAIQTASMLLRFVSGILVTVGAFLWLGYVEDEDGKLFVGMCCVVSGLLGALNPKEWFDARMEMTKHGVMLFLEKLIFVCFLFAGWALWWKNSFTPGNVAACLLLTAAVSFAYQWVFAFQSYRIDVANLASNFRWLVAENTTILIAGIANLFITQINQLVLEHHHGAANLGHFAVGFQIVRVVQIMQTRMAQVLAPGTARVTGDGDGPAIRRAMLNYGLAATVGTIVILLPVFLAVPFGIRRFLPAEYEASVVPFRWLCVWCVLYGPALIISQFVISLRLNRIYLLITVASGILAVGVGQWLVPNLGVRGTAYALLFSHAVSILCQWVVCWRAADSGRQSSASRRSFGAAAHNSNVAVAAPSRNA